MESIECGFPQEIQEVDGELDMHRPFIDKVVLSPTDANTNQDLICTWTLSSGDTNAFEVNVTILKNGNVFKNPENIHSSKGDNTQLAAAKADTFIGNTFV